MDVKRLQSAVFPSFADLKLIQSTYFSKFYYNFFILIFAENSIGEVKNVIFQTLILPYVVICENWVVAPKARVVGSHGLQFWTSHNPGITAM